MHILLRNRKGWFLLFCLLFPSVLHCMEEKKIQVLGLERIEPDGVKWGRRAMGATSLCVSGLLIYDGIKNKRWGKKRISAIAGSLIFGFGAFNTKELGLARPVYHENNSREEDTKISQFAFAYKNLLIQRGILNKPDSFVLEKDKHEEREDYDEEDEEEGGDRDEKKKDKVNDKKKGVVQIPLHFLQRVYALQRYKRPNKVYFTQQKPMLARLPAIGICFDGLYDEESFEQLSTMVFKNGKFEPISFAFWLLNGSYKGILRWWKQEKTPKDKEFESGILSAAKELYVMSNIWQEQQKNSEYTSRLAWLPRELFEQIAMYISGHTGYVENSFIYMDKKRAAKFFVPYVGPYIKLKPDTLNYEGKTIEVCRVRIRNEFKQEGKENVYKPLESFLTLMGLSLWSIG